MPDAMVVVEECRFGGRMLALGRRRAHVGRASRRGREERARGGQSGQRRGSMRSYGQSSFALVGILATPHLRWSEWSSMGVTDASDSRLGVLTRWVTEDLGFAGSRIEPASADASFRRYFRVTRGSESYIVMDAPPDKETLEPFVGVARVADGTGAERSRGSGARRARRACCCCPISARASTWTSSSGAATSIGSTRDALDALVSMQTRGAEAARGLPPYDRAAAPSRNGADAGVVSGRATSDEPAGPGERAHARPAVRVSVAKRARTARDLRASRLPLAQSPGDRARAIPASWIFRMRCAGR